MMLAAHPDKARRIIAMFDEVDAKAKETEIEQVMPKGHEETENVLQDLRRFGISLRTDGNVNLRR